MMFADHELIGIPHRVVVSERGLQAGTVEYKFRGKDEIQHINTDEIAVYIKQQIDKSQFISRN